MKFDITKEWCMAISAIEDGCDVGAGSAVLQNKEYMTSNLYNHAKRELELAGLFDETSDYSGNIGKDVLALMAVFCSQGHSGYSSRVVSELFSKLSQYKILNPENFIPSVEDSIDISEYSGAPKGTKLQSARLSSVFSDDGGKNWYDIYNKDWSFKYPCRSAKFLKK